MIYRNLLLALAWLSLTTATAQDAADNETAYLRGKRLLRTEQPDAAIATLSSLVEPGNANRYAPYALYLRAVAQYRQGKYLDARQDLLRLLERFPYWEDREEGVYLLGCTEMQRENYAQGLSRFSECDDPTLRAEAQAFTYQALSGQPIAELTILYDQYPKNKGLAMALHDQLGPQGAAAAADLLRRLEADHGLKPTRVTYREAERKEAYRVALLFPFDRQRLDPEGARRSQFLIDLYQGIRLAVRDLREAERPPLTLYVYDTERSQEATQQLLSLPEMRGMNLIIGPVYAENARLAAEFAARQQILTVNPLSDRLELTAENPYYVLASTSPETRAERAANYAFEQFGGGPAVLVTGSKAADSAFVRAYERVYTGLGGSVVEHKTASQAAPAELRSWLRRYGIDEEGNPLGEDSSEASHFVVTLEDPDVAANFVTGMEVNRVARPVIAPGEWLDGVRVVSFDQWERQRVHFLFSDYVDADEETVQAFREAYLRENNLVPSVYAYQGYRLMYYFGEMLARHGTGLAERIRKEPTYNNLLSGGFNYRDASDNRYLPIVRVESNRLVVER